MAKEFVACQIKKPGVLILSPFAGAGKPLFMIRLGSCIDITLVVYIGNI